MAGPVFIPTWVLCTLRLKQGTEIYSFNYSYRYIRVGLLTDAELLSIATAVYGIIQPTLAPLVSTTTQFISVTARDMGSAAGHEATYIPGGTVLGTAAGDPEPASIAAVTTYNPSVVGKGVKGRTFWTAFVESEILNQVVTSGLVAALATLAAGLRTYAGPLTATLVAAVASRKHVVMRDIVSSTASNQVDVQFRRLLGHKRHRRRVTP